MKTAIALVEGMLSLDRIWLGPRGEVKTLSDADSHSGFVMEHPETFGLSEANLAPINDAWERDGELDYEYAIALGERQGWARVSTDSKVGLAISAGSARAAQHALRYLEEKGQVGAAADIEISAIRQDALRLTYYNLDADALATFLQYGRLPVGRSRLTPIACLTEQ